MESVALTGFLLAACMLVYVQAIYPVMLGVLSKCNGKNVRRREFYPTVTLVIPAYNEEGVIKDKITNSLRLDYPRDKLTIAVASDGSTDGTNNIVSAYKNHGVVLKAFAVRKGKVSVLNNTVAAFSSEVVVFSDANVMYKPNALKMLVRNLADPTVGAVTGKVVLSSDSVSFCEGESLYYKVERFLQTAESATGSLIGADGAMYAIRRELYEPPPPSTILDDFVIPMAIARRGWRVVYEPEAIGHEDSAPTIREEFFRRVRIAAGAVQILRERLALPRPNQPMLLWKFCTHKVLRWSMPIWLTLLFVSNLFLLAEPFYAALFVVQGTFYLLGTIGGVIQPAGRLFSIPTYFCVAEAATSVGLIKGLLNRQSVKWRVARRDTRQSSRPVSG